MQQGRCAERNGRIVLGKAEAIVPSEAEAIVPSEAEATVKFRSQNRTNFKLLYIQILF
jgi:hypothetical protein